FEVTQEGTIAFDPAYASFLAGAGSACLTITGLPVTIDARYLSGSGVLLVTPSTSEDWIALKTCRMVPASHYRVQQGSGVVASFEFALGIDGTISYDPAYDVAA